MPSDLAWRACMLTQTQLTPELTWRYSRKYFKRRTRAITSSCALITAPICIWWEFFSRFCGLRFFMFIRSVHWTFSNEIFPECLHAFHLNHENRWNGWKVMRGSPDLLTPTHNYAATHRNFYHQKNWGDTRILHASVRRRCDVFLAPPIILKWKCLLINTRMRT